MRQTLPLLPILCALTLTGCSYSTSVVNESIQPIDVTSSTQKEPSSFEIFKREMMPQVGQKTTVVGVMKLGKLGSWVDFKGWGVYIKATKDHDIAKMNELDQFLDHTVEVTGTLQYSPEPPAPKTDVIEARAPEHFYFDVAEAKVISLKAPARSKRKGQYRPR
jgi:hypothetical protein